MRAVAIALLATGCGSPTPKCEDLGEMRLTDLQPLDAIHACASRLRKPCAEALARATPDLSEPAADAIFADCVRAYPELPASLATDRHDWFMVAVNDGYIGAMVAQDLQPRAIAVHLDGASVAIDGIGKFGTDAAAVAALRAHGAHGGLLLWGTGADRTRFAAALRGTDIEYVACVRPADCRTRPRE